MKILIIGGYGTFGGRLADLLADVDALTLLIAGRSLVKAQAFCAAWRGAARVIPVAVTREAIAGAIADHGPDLVVDASGPFQAYDGPSHVVRACISARVPYLDLADGAEFVDGIAALDAEARAAGVFALSGVSSFPVLTAAVARELGRDMTIRKMTAGIAPSPYAGVGPNVLRAVLGYAGGPVRLRRGGADTTAFGLTESRRGTIAPPGLLPLHNLRFSLVDVPDLRVLPRLYPTITDVWVGAASAPDVLHRGLNLLARLRAWLHLPSFAPLAPVFHWVLRLCRFGEHRGGMFVEIAGEVEGRPVTRTWHMLAEGDDGPKIPSMAIEGIVRKMLDGGTPAPGARPATQDLSLDDYRRLFARRDIREGTRTSDQAAAPLYPALLGEAFTNLPAPVQALQASREPRAWVGQAEVRCGKNPVARLIARIYGFPPATQAIPVRVDFSPEGDGELWHRTFGPSRFRSHQHPGRGRNAHLLVERFGPIRVGLALVVRDDRLYLIPRRWSFLGLPLPRALLPRGSSFETARNGTFCFDVEIAAPLIGLIVGYRGQLEPQGHPTQGE